MPTDKPRILITVEKKLFKEIDNFRYSEHIPTRSEAVRRLLREALKKYEKKSK
jgi:metal-responsive CopG/Arc/MetJ family transcriptional regulator